MYPFADSAFVIGLLLGDWRTLILPFIIFTAFDVAYATWGVWREPKAWRLMLAVPLQRVVYRQLLYYSVMKGVVRAFEGTGSSWNKFTKMGGDAALLLYLHAHAGAVAPFLRRCGALAERDRASAAKRPPKSVCSSKQ